MISHCLISSTQSLLLTIPGDLVCTTVEELKSDAFAIFVSDLVASAGWTTLNVDCSAAKRIDSHGLNLLVALYKRAKKANASTCVIISDPNIQRVLRFTRMDAHVKVFVTSAADSPTLSSLPSLAA